MYLPSLSHIISPAVPPDQFPLKLSVFVDMLSMCKPTSPEPLSTTLFI